MSHVMIVPWTGLAALEFKDVTVPAREPVAVRVEWADERRQKWVNVERADGVRVTVPAGCVREVGKR